jgi:hypothetical protein
MSGIQTFFFVVGLIASGHAADPTKPHPNRGVNPPFKAGAPDIALSAADLDTIALGKTIQRQMVNKETGTGTALAILDVAAPVDVVLDRILDFKAYPEVNPLRPRHLLYFLSTYCIWLAEYIELLNQCKFVKTIDSPEVFVSNYKSQAFYRPDFVVLLLRSSCTPLWKW